MLSHTCKTTGSCAGISGTCHEHCCISWLTDLTTGASLSMESLFHHFFPPQIICKTSSHQSSYIKWHCEADPWHLNCLVLGSYLTHPCSSSPRSGVRPAPWWSTKTPHRPRCTYTTWLAQGLPNLTKWSLVKKKRKKREMITQGQQNIGAPSRWFLLNNHVETSPSRWDVDSTHIWFRFSAWTAGKASCHSHTAVMSQHFVMHLRAAWHQGFCQDVVCINKAYMNPGLKKKQQRE